MEPNTPNVTNIDINKEMRGAYLQYSMSVIVGRALPDVRDGLKPVHRRILYAMHDLNNLHNKPYKKSARIVGDVIGKYHPHGDVAVYDTMVRMAQDFSLRYPLIDGQGNFGSVDGDSPAAQRYTEVRMTELAEEILFDIDKETVNFGPNYDDSLQIPLVMPAKFPNLLVNGSSGIAVGMATNIPPHNLREVVEACIALIEDPTLTVDGLMKYVKGPDFPTSGVIAGYSGIVSAYKTGKGIITIKAVAEVITEKDREHIIINQIPYQVNKAKLIEDIADLVKDKKIEGISDIRDESSREGMRIVVILKRGENAQVILNRLYKYTQLQVSYGIIMLALDSRNQPRVFDLRSMIQCFIDHRRDVVTRRCIFDLKKAEARAHILEGLKLALNSIDKVIETIRASKEAHAAKENLISTFSFSELQAQAILEMRLQRLTGLERQKIQDELTEVAATVAWLKKVLADTGEIYKLIKEELKEIRDKYGDVRKTQIEGSESDIDDEDLIAEEEVIISITNSGSIKRIPTEEYRVQKRGGKGLKGAETKDEEYVWKIFAVDTKTTLLIFTDRGKVYWLKAHMVPKGSRISKGKAIANVVNLAQGETVRAILPIKTFPENNYVILLTEKGIIKKSSLEAFSRPRPSGIIALTTDLEDTVIDAKISTGTQDVFIVTREGMSIRFDEDDVREMGRSARGVKGITLGEGDKVVGMEVVDKDSKENVLIITEGGFGKRSEMSEYRSQSRGGVGIITQKTTDKVGLVVTAKRVFGMEQIIISTDKGQSIRTRVNEVPVLGRNTQGVKVINLNENEIVTGATTLEESEDEIALPILQ